MSRKRRAERRRTHPCPHCGESVAVGKLACPECGSDAETGWKDEDEIAYQSVEIPDYWEEPDGASKRSRWIASAVVLAVLAAFLIWVLGLFR